MSLGGGLLGVPAEMLNVFRCVICELVSRLGVSSQKSAYFLPLMCLPCCFDSACIGLTVLHQQPSISTACWFWVILPLHPWLLTTPWMPVGTLSLSQPRCSTSLQWSSRLAAGPTERWLTMSVREKVSNTDRVSSPQHTCCHLHTFASQQRSYS